MHKFLPLGLITLLIGCYGEQANTQGRQEQSMRNINDTLQYSYQNLKETSPYFITCGTKDAVDTTFYQISYPIFSSKRINEVLRPSILIDNEDTPHDAADSFLDAYNEFVEDSNMQKINAAWFKNVQTKVLVNTPRLLTVKTTVEEYTGGAHGNHLTLYANIDLLKAEKLQLKDLIMPDKLEELRRIAEQYFRQKERLSDTASLAKDFFFPDGLFVLNDNFGLTKEHLLLFYNEYEIKPYAAGVTELAIPYRELTKVWSARGKDYLQSLSNNF